MNLRNGPFSGAMLEVIGCYEPILGNGHLKKKKKKNWKMNQFYIFFSFHNWAILCLPSMKIHEQG